MSRPGTSPTLSVAGERPSRARGSASPGERNAILRELGPLGEVGGSAERLGLDCLADLSAEARRAGLARAWEPAIDTALWEFAEQNRITSIVAHGLADAVGEGLPARWGEAHAATERCIAEYLAELDRVAERFEREGIRLVALKNAGIARGTHPCPGCSPMGDLDVLVSRERFPDAHRLLGELGFRAATRSKLEGTDLEAALRSGGLEYRTTLVGGRPLWFELQWRPVAGRWIRPDQEPAAEALLERSVAIPGSAARRLHPVDDLLQVTLHTAKHTYLRAPGVRLHTDVDRIVRRRDIDWDEFVRTVQRLEVRTAVYFSLALPLALFGTPVPAPVLEALRPDPWRLRAIARRLERAGLFDPDQRKFSNAGYVVLAALLYDDLGGLRRAIFPETDWLRRRYGAPNGLGAWACHFRRWGNLLLRRSL